MRQASASSTINDMGMGEEHQKWGVITNLLLLSIQATGKEFDVESFLFAGAVNISFKTSSFL